MVERRRRRGGSRQQGQGPRRRAAAAPPHAHGHPPTPAPATQGRAAPCNALYSRLGGGGGGGEGEEGEGEQGQARQGAPPTAAGGGGVHGGGGGGGVRVGMKGEEVVSSGERGRALYPRQRPGPGQTRWVGAGLSRSICAGPGAALQAGFRVAESIWREIGAGGGRRDAPTPWPPWGGSRRHPAATAGWALMPPLPLGGNRANCARKPGLGLPGPSNSGCQGFKAGGPPPCRRTARVPVAAAPPKPRPPRGPCQLGLYGGARQRAGQRKSGHSEPAGR